jgi:hypothetical protein
MWLRIAIETSKRYHPILAAVDQEDGRLDAGQVRRRKRVYAGIRTFISVMPWIRFE